MCLAVPGKVINIDGSFATVEMLGFDSEVFIGLIRDLQLGDHVLVHAGCAIEKINKEAFDYFKVLCQDILNGDTYEG